MDDDLQQPLYKPSLDHDSLPAAAAPLVTADQCRNLQHMDDSQLIGPPDEPCVAPPPPSSQITLPAQLAPAVKLEVEVVLGESAPAKRRRGRPPKGQGKVTSAQSRVKKTEDEEEDVCFICFDGGSLVLCDRRSCPKAYHPACIKRDEAFFRSKAKWNCGWHICSSCQKASHYMCYTCTYSSCKGCIKDADYVCVRGNKGLCGICIRTIMLIENNVPENQETVKVDFDDKTSWEYLFKVYWVYLKEKLSLTLDELTQAKNPWKEPDHEPSKRERSRELFGGNIDKYSSSDNFYVNLEGNNSKRRRMRKQSTHLNKDQLSVEKLGPNKEMPQLENPKWATKELLEFVAHMKNGDTSVLSQFDVQNLLLEYIKRNNLRDPQKKCQIICDSRLVLLFGKERVGHIEMLQLLEFHFLIKESAQRNNLIEGAVLDPCSGQVEADWISDNQPTMTSDKKRKKRKKADEGGPNSNLDEYAAINVHNINLIFLRRTLMENLIDDTDKFHDKVVGSIVRIRISNSDQKQDMYRLVQVVGTSKVAEPYKIGSKTTDVMLEILNLDKKEVISIDEISNQEFTEDECKCLRQYIKCGLIKRLSVGEIQEKAMKLQAVRVNDWLEAETLRLGHLRDRASEKGLRKELRECVEKLQLLNSPEERQRRLLAIPEVHADPNMDPSHDSEDGSELDWKKSGNHTRLRSFGFGRKERESVSPLNTYPSNVDKDDGNLSWHPGSEALGLKSSSTSKNKVDSTGSTAGGKNDLAVVRSELSCGVASEISGPVPYTGPEQSANEMETDKLWNYQDPTGKIQGPFCLVQLRKWSITGHFPPDLKIWRLNGKQDDSILLIDALDGRYDAEQPLLSNSCLLPEEVRVTAVDGDDNKNGGLSGGFNTTQDNSKKEDSWDAKQNDENALSNGKEESERSKELGSPSCSSAPSLDVINSDEEKAASVLLGWDSMKGNNSRSVQPQVSCSLPSSIISSEDLSNQVRKDPISEGLNSSQNNGNCNSHETVDVRGDSGHSPEKQSNSHSNSGQSAAEDRRLHVEEWDSKVVTTSSVKPNEMASDHAATPTSMSELTHSSPAHPVPNASSWQLLVNGPEELFPLVDESVSDLLAEVEAMESLCGLSSGTSNINCGGELVQDSKNDCFDPAEGFSPTRDLGKNDALSSTGDLQISLQCTVKDEPREISESDVRPIELFSKSAEVEAKPSELFPASSIGTSAMAAAAAYSTWSGGPETVQTTLTIKPSDVSVSQWQASAGIPPPPASTTIGSLGMVAADSTWRGGPETTAAAASWVSSEQGNPNLGWIGGLSLGNSNMGWTGTGTSTATATGTSTGTMLQHLNVNWGNSHTGNQGIWGNQPRHGGERYPSPRDRYLQSSGDFSYGNGNGSSSSRGRSSWSRQVGGGNGGGGGGGGSSFRSPPKGQRVCKFYESGYCKKGASCSYLHP